jgi:hypothetical protein
MRVKVKRPCRQVFALTIVLLVLLSCNGKKDESPVIPPETPPLSREMIGFGVVNVSYTHVTAEPLDGSASPGYLRRGAVVKILERKMVKDRAAVESWVLAEGIYQGWLREAVVDIYDSEAQAFTASESMNR